MSAPTWGGIEVEAWPTDSSKPSDRWPFGEDVEAAIDRARFLSRTMLCRTTRVLAVGSNIELARFAGRWALDNPEGI